MLPQLSTYLWWLSTTFWLFWDLSSPLFAWHSTLCFVNESKIIQNFLMMLTSLILMVFRIVRLTSPNLNYFIIAGSYIMYSSIFMRLIPSGDETVNHVRCNVSRLYNTAWLILTINLKAIISIECMCSLLYILIVGNTSHHACLLPCFWHHFGQSRKSAPHL